MKGIVLASLFICSSSIVYSETIGDYSQTHNYPGYIDLHSDGQAYKGPYTRNVDYGDGVILKTPSSLISSYFSHEKINIGKINKIILEIRQIQEDARIAFCQTEQARENLSQVGCRREFPRDVLNQSWDKKSVNVAYNYAIQLFEEAKLHSLNVTPENINTSIAQPFLEAFFNGLEIYQGVLQESSQIGRYSGIIQKLNLYRDGVRPITITRARPEAANLLRQDPEERSVFYSPEELEELKNEGIDISLFNPPDSGFWRNPTKSIKDYDTSKYNGEEIASFREELTQKQVDDLMDPVVTIRVDYKEIINDKSATSPEILVKYGNTNLVATFAYNRVANKNVLRFEDEDTRFIKESQVNTETVVNNLAASLGFAVNGTYFKHIVKVFFENDHYNAIKKMSERYQASIIENIKLDPISGRKYLELRQVQLERKSEVNNDIDVGSFVRKGLGKSLKREHRAFALFLAWIWDVESKDMNNSLKMVPYTDSLGKTKYKIVMSNSDMGHALGANRPNTYNFNLIREVKKDRNGPYYMRLNYLRLYPNDLLEAITFDDAKWMARLIGQLSEKQLFAAYFAAGYPHVIAQYYTGIMLKKRNELLESLNLLDESFINSNNETITLRRTWEFNDSIKGHEELFHNGHINDPYWGAGLNNSEENPQSHFIKLLTIKVLTKAGDILYNSFFSKAGYSTEGFKFKEILMPSGEQVEGCSGSCFFQGFNSGINGFVPWRFIIENPDEDSKVPYLIVDIFRLGFFAGTKIQKTFGLDIPSDQLLGIGASHYQISEFMKVRPVEKIFDLFKSKSDLLKMPKLNFKTARATVIESLKENEYLIQSHYVGIKAMAKFKPNIGLAIPIAPSITFRGDLLAANRITFMGKAESKVLVGWDKIREASINSRFNLLDYLIKLPILESELKKLNNMQRTFEFDRKKKEDRDVLYKNINKILPSDIPEKYSLAKRTTHLSERSTTWRFFKFIRRTSTRRSINVEYHDYLNEYYGSNVNYVREIDRSRVTRRLGKRASRYTIQSGINSHHEVFAKITLTGNFENMTKYKFKSLLNHYAPLLPENFIQFNPESVAENFGTLELNIETIFPEKGLRDIFSLQIDKRGLCKVYSRIQNHQWSDEDCIQLSRIKSGFLRRISKAKKRFLKLWKKYEQTRNTFWEIIKDRTDDSTSMHSKLKKIVDLMTDKGDYNYHVMNLFIALAQSPNYFRKASMYSALDAFPGQISTINEDIGSAGTYQPSPSMRASNPAREFKLFSDLLHQSLKRMFYNNQYLYDNL